jgi:hypothetical protein
MGFWLYFARQLRETKKTVYEPVINKIATRSVPEVVAKKQEEWPV